MIFFQMFICAAKLHIIIDITKYFVEKSAEG